MSSFSMQGEVERVMMELGSGVITDLDRFMMPDLDNCDIYGKEIRNEVDYFGGSAFDYEPN